MSAQTMSAVGIVVGRDDVLASQLEIRLGVGYSLKAKSHPLDLGLNFSGAVERQPSAF